MGLTGEKRPFQQLPLGTDLEQDEVQHLGTLVFELSLELVLRASKTDAI